MATPRASQGSHHCTSDCSHHTMSWPQDGLQCQLVLVGHHSPLDPGPLSQPRSKCHSGHKGAQRWVRITRLAAEDVGVHGLRGHVWARLCGIWDPSTGAQLSSRTYSSSHSHTEYSELEGDPQGISSAALQRMAQAGIKPTALASLALHGTSWANPRVQHGHKQGGILASVAQHESANVLARIAIAPQNELDCVVN